MAPAYDMLPMSLTPSRTGKVRAVAPVQPNVPERTGQVAHVVCAIEVAMRFWERVAENEWVRSDEVRALAEVNRVVVTRFGGMSRP